MVPENLDTANLRLPAGFILVEKVSSEQHL